MMIAQRGRFFPIFGIGGFDGLFILFALICRDVFASADVGWLLTGRKPWFGALSALAARRARSDDARDDVDVVVDRGCRKRVPHM